MSRDFKPPDKKDVEREYEQKCPLYKQLAEEVQYILSNVIDTKKIHISVIEPRVKDFEDFYEKILRKKIADNPFDHIKDISGVRVICLYRSDLDHIGDLIKKNFSVIEEKIPRKETSKPFGYLSDHYIVNLPESYSGARYDSIKSLKCEIQVRTVSMHAWTTVSHHLDYKHEIDIPSNLKGDFYALSGVFYIADSLFEQFRDARESAVEEIMKKVKLDQFNLDNELNLDTLKAFLAWKFPNREDSDDPLLLTQLVNDFKTDYRELNHLIEEHRSELSDSSKHVPFFTRMGALRMILRYKYPGLSAKLFIGEAAHVLERESKKKERKRKKEQGTN